MPHHGGDRLDRVPGAERREQQMSTYPQVPVCMETMDLPLTTVSVLINEDSLATVASQLDTLERLIARYGAQAFWGEPDAEAPRQTA
jgi:hypothetical protein